MGRLKHISIFILLLGSLVRAQNSNPKALENIGISDNETLFVHANTASLLAGETLYCKLYCLDPSGKKPSGISKIVYIELIGSDLKSVFKHKLRIENGMAKGDFFIPATIKSGNYKLIAYTRFMIGKSANDFSVTDLSIVNPFQPFEEKKDSLQANRKPANHTNKVLAIQPNKKTYATREKISLKIALSDGAKQKGHYSLSVRKTDGLPTGKTLRADEFNPSEINVPLKPGLNLLPELRGEMISGRITSKKGSTNLGNKTITLSMPGKSFLFKIVQTDNSGRFIFILDKNPYNTEMTIEVMEADRQDYTLELDDYNKPDLSGLIFSPLSLNPGLKNEIEQRSIANQVENAYYERKKDSIAASAKTEPFFHPLEKVYVLDDYTRFPTLKETIIEVLKEIYFTRSNGNYTLHLRNMTMDAEIYGLPLVLVDGLLLQDVDPLFEYETKYVEKVSLVNEPYIYGPKTFSGLINFTTKNQDFKSKASGTFIKKLSFDRPIPDKTYFKPDYSSQQSSNRIPDYRYQLAWIPEISGESDITFYASDISGEFEITLEGFTETGIPVSIKEFFEVK